jgi:Tfp pilus assembly protein PilX
MKKDVIYIDIEDDITAIIGKVKEAHAKVVALVPPKRTSVLQSAVNLKLLQKAAAGLDKRAVLITNDHSLISLAAGVKMPVAKNLQSRPEIPSIAALEVDDSDIINGNELPVGDIAAAAGTVTPGDQPGSVADEMSDQVDLKSLNEKPKPTAKNTAGGALAAVKNKAKGIKIPNFMKFRKRLFLLGGGALLLTLFFIWALVIAPNATVTINAKTSAVSIDRTLALDAGLAASKPNELQLRPNVQQIKKAASTEFDATGTKDTGQQATGKMTITNSSNSDPVTVPSGTIFIANSGQKFTSTGTAMVPGARLVNAAIVAGSTSVTVVAADIGPEYNVAAQSYSIQGFASLSAKGDQMSGGSREKVTVVSDEDVNKAKEKLTGQQDVNAIKSDLKKQFNGDYILIDESFNTEIGAPSVEPRVGEQAQKGKLTMETTYTLVGLTRKEVKEILDTVLKDALDDKPNQSIYSSGDNSIQFLDFEKTSATTYAARLKTTGYIGASIDTKKLAEQLKGKRYGEIEQIVNQISGVEKVDIKFSPFWVTSAPQSADKINIRFSVVNDTN